MIRLWSFFGTTEEDPSNFRGFPEMPVEKPVENVDNPCGRIGEKIMIVRYVNSFRHFSPVS